MIRPNLKTDRKTIYLLYTYFLDEIDAILPSIGESVQTLNEQAHHFAFDVIFVHFKYHLLTVPKMEVKIV